MMGEEVEEEYEMCVGHQCFLRPHALYLPPPYYERIPHRNGGVLMSRSSGHFPRPYPAWKSVSPGDSGVHGACPQQAGDPHPGTTPAPGTQVWVRPIPGMVGLHPAVPGYHPPLPVEKGGHPLTRIPKKEKIISTI
eukprot:Gb_03129 [translate_table: standard]